MLRSKSRSDHNYSSVFSRTLSASKLCRGDALGRQIEATALKSVDKRNSQKQVDRGMSIQNQMREMEEELREAKEAAHEAKMRANQSLSPKKAGELIVELDNLKKLLAGVKDELKTKEKKIGSLEDELGKTREIEEEKDEYLDRLKEELRGVKEREKEKTALLSVSNKRIQELEGEVEREKKSGSRMASSLAVHSKQLDETIFELEESKIEIASLHEKIDGLEDLCKHISGEVKWSNGKDEDHVREEEIRFLKENLIKVEDGEKKALLRVESLVQEMEVVKKEWKLAVDGEEKSRKAMEDLVVALQEVAMEANQAKEKLRMTETELQHVKGETEQLKEMIRATEERYKNVLLEAKQETEYHKNTADRLRVEAEESLFAWNGKEMGFVTCIKRAEEERAMAQIENHKLAESLQAAENMTRAAREETYKLRDILKQAISEANAAKAAAGIARDENSLLKDCLAEKEEALHFITRENERLRISEAAAEENVKQLKRMLSMVSADFKTDDKDLNAMLKFADSVHEERVEKKVTRAFSFNLEDLKFMNEPEDDVLDEDPEKADALKGSIFDASAETPKSEVHTPKAAAFKQKKTEEDDLPPKPAAAEDAENMNSVHEDAEADKHPHRRQKSMFQRVGGLLTIRKSFHRKEPSIDRTKELSVEKKEPTIDQSTTTTT